MGKDLEMERLKGVFSNELPLLRMKLKLSQEDLARMVGLSRQTISLAETGSRKMEWRMFLLLYLFFDANEETRRMMSLMGDFREKMRKHIDVTKREPDGHERDGTL